MKEAPDRVYSWKQEHPEEYSRFETSAKPQIDIEIINITHGLSIVAFRYKKTFAEVSFLCGIDKNGAQ